MIHTPTRRHLYGRRLGRPLRAQQAETLARVRQSHGFDADAFPALAARYRETWLEIGFGAGEHLVWQAAQHPDVLLIGAEIYLNGFARACKHIDAAGLDNARLYYGDGRALMDCLGPRSLARAFILHPDPWPKARQRRRRIVTRQMLDHLATLLVAGGTLRVASDHGDYQPWILRVLLAHPDFVWTAERARDWTERPADWPQTRYEAKSVEAGRPTMYIEARRA